MPTSSGDPAPKHRSVGRHQFAVAHVGQELLRGRQLRQVQPRDLGGVGGVGQTRRLVLVDQLDTHRRRQ